MDMISLSVGISATDMLIMESSPGSGWGAVKTYYLPGGTSLRHKTLVRLDHIIPKDFE